MTGFATNGAAHALPGMNGGAISFLAHPTRLLDTRGISPNAVQNGGGPITSYGVAPALPAGLTLNAATGVISGTPTVLAVASSYTITGTNAAGSTPVSITITARPTLDLTPPA